MKILFLCGSAEPGKDGVGDYTRRLSGELIRQGHSCAVVAIMDKGVSGALEETQQIESTNVPVLRLPYRNGYEKSCIDAKLWVDAFNPEWISLQYVPFSFHSKGMPLGLANAIKQLSKGRNVHIMFHELWLGMDIKASFKFKIWGKVQSVIIRSFIDTLKPLSIQTQTKLYQKQLLKLGISVNIMPLFGNIPVLFDFNVMKGTELLDSKKKFSVIIFGTIHYGAPVEVFTNSVSKYALSSNVDIKIIFIGRCGEEIKEWVSTCKSKRIKTEVLGELSSVKISEVLSKADLGITTTPFLLAEKSGTVAAMKEHGLPILCVSRAWDVKDFPVDYSPIGIQLFEEHGLAHYITNKSESQVVNSLSEISNQFLDSLLNFK